jgi:hypothetical protein
MMKSGTKFVVYVDRGARSFHPAFDIRARLKRNPYGMLAGAVGIGFVLGGGLFTRLAVRVVGPGLRIAGMVAMPILQEQIAAAIAGSTSDTKKENDT